MHAWFLSSLNTIPKLFRTQFGRPNLPVKLLVLKVSRALERLNVCRAFFHSVLKKKSISNSAKEQKIQFTSNSAKKQQFKLFHRGFSLATIYSKLIMKILKDIHSHTRERILYIFFLVCHGSHRKRSELFILISFVWCTGKLIDIFQCRVYSVRSATVVVLHCQWEMGNFHYAARTYFGWIECNMA